MSESSQGKSSAPQGIPEPAASGERPADALYQNGRVVARVEGVELDLDAQEIRFAEVYNSDELLIPDECEFQKYRILIQRIAYASKLDRQAAHRGRVLRGVSADLLGYLEP